MMRNLFVLPAILLATAAWSQSLGLFDGHTDVGTVLHPGSVEYDAAKQTYTVSGSGENMWFATDAFQFAWKKVSGDVTITADVSFLGEGKEAHRKAVLMIRQSLDPDSAYADIARHGDGLTSLQARDEKGAITTEIQSTTRAPTRLRITKQGDRFYISVAEANEDLRFAGGSMRVPMGDPFYVGIGVCSHNKDVIETAVFSNVLIQPAATAPATLQSTLEVVPVTGDRRVVYVTPGRISAAQWTTDGTALNFRRRERIERVPLTGGEPQLAQPIPTIRPPGDYTYNHSDRSGSFQIWRTRPGGEPEQVTSDNYQNVFPHVSPDDQLLAFLSFRADKPAIPADTDVMLRVLSLKDNKLRVVAKFIGGQGSLDAPWSPDSRRLAYVSYQLADNWGPLQFLVGKWTGEGGSFSLLPDLQGKVLVRKSFSQRGPRHDDLMIIYREGNLRANYYDSEGHIISYVVQPVEGGVAFMNPSYKLTYLADGDQKAKLKFEIKPPGKDFLTYIEATINREP